MRKRVLLALTCGLAATFGSVLATSAAPVPAPDYLATSNVKYIGNLPEAGDGVGARVVGHYLYVTSSVGLFIYDISDPVNPVLVSKFTLAVEWENEQVPTNGKLLGLSASGVIPLLGGGGCELAGADYVNHPGVNCLAAFDVTDKANPKAIAVTFGAGDHTSTCILDCTYTYGSSGHIVDWTHVAKDGVAPLIGMWNDPSNKLPGRSTHHQNEVTNGYILVASQPIMLLSVLPQDGGSVLHPALLAIGKNADGRFIHSTQWPRQGRDNFALIGGETNFNERCTQQSGAFMVWDASRVINPDGGYNKGSQFRILDEYRVQPGTYSDGGPPVNVLGCSVHWFEEHPTFHNGGLVALAAYESGTRFIQVTDAGKIKEVGYFIPVGRGSTSAPHWAPDGKTLYVIDYERGVDILQWTGPTYVPTGQTEGAAAPTPSPTPAPSASQSTPLPLTSRGGPTGWIPLALVAMMAFGLVEVARRGRSGRPG